MLSKKKKIFIIVGMVLLLAATAWLQIALFNNNPDETDDLETGNFFTSSRLIRESTRAQEILYYQSIINTEGEEFAEARAAATDEMMRLIALYDLEFDLETLIKAKGYEDVYVSLNVNSDNVNVMLKKGEDQTVTPQDAAIVYSVIKELTGRSIECVTITVV